jgi:membrane protein implicated in regulation of membrane protease activity
MICDPGTVLLVLLIAALVAIGVLAGWYWAIAALAAVAALTVYLFRRNGWR